MLPLLLAGAGLLAAPALLAPLRERRSHRELARGGTYALAGGYEIWYQDEGPRGAEPAIVLHGFAAWSPTLEAQRQALLGAGLRVIMVDLLGCGASARAAAPTYATDAHAARVRALLAQLGVTRCALAGHSFGGRVAMQIAIDAPSLVSRLALIAPEAFAAERPPVAAAVGAPLIGYPLAFYATSPLLVRSGLQLAVRRAEALSDAVVAEYALPLTVRGSADSQVWQARSPKDGARPVPQHLGAIGCPTAIIWGEHDPIFPASDGARLRDALPGAQLEIIAGVGHLPQHEDAGATSAALVRALAG